MDIKKGGTIVFKGYSEKPKDGEDFLKKGEKYEVVEVNKDDNSVAVQIATPYAAIAAIAAGLTDPRLRRTRSTG